MPLFPVPVGTKRIASRIFALSSMLEPDLQTGSGQNFPAPQHGPGHDSESCRATSTYLDLYLGVGVYPDRKARLGLLNDVSNEVARGGLAHLGAGQGHTGDRGRSINQSEILPNFPIIIWETKTNRGTA